MISQVPNESAGLPRQTICRYAWHYLCVLTVTGFFFVGLPFIASLAGKPVTLALYAGCFAMGVLLLVLVIFQRGFSVEVVSDGLVIKRRLGRDRRVAFSEVAHVHVYSMRNGLILVASLRGGGVLRFSGMLTNFSKLVRTLELQVPPDLPSR